MSTSKEDSLRPPPELVIPEGVRRAIGDNWLGWILVATILCSALAYSFDLVAFTHAKEAVLGIGVSLGAAGLLFRGGVSWRGLRAFAPLWLGLIVVVAIGLGPAPARLPWRVVQEAIRLSLLLATAAVAHDLLEQHRWRMRLRGAIIAAAVIAAILGVMQYAGFLRSWFPAFTGNDQRVYSVFANQDLFGGYLAIGLALFAPVLISVRRGFGAGLPIFCILLAALILSASRSAWLAAVAGMLAGIPWRALWSRRIAALVLAAASLCGVSVWLTPERTVDRVRQTFSERDTGGNLRLWFWDGALRMAADAPLTGIGLDNFGFWSPHYQARVLAAPGGDRYTHNELHTEEPHSEPLRLFAESGLIGCVFLLWMLFRLGRTRGPEWGALVSLCVFSCFNGAFLSAPHALAGLLLAGMLLARGKHIPMAEHDSGILAVTMVILVPALTAGVFWTRIVPSYRLAAAETAHLAGENALPLYERALSHPWPSPEGREEYGLALWESGQLQEARLQFELALDGLDTGRVHLQLARTADLLGDAEAARRAYAACLWRWPGNSDAWRGLWRLSDEEDWPALRAHAKRWNIETQKTMEELLHSMPE